MFLVLIVIETKLIWMNAVVLVLPPTMGQKHFPTSNPITAVLNPRPAARNFAALDNKEFCSVR